MVYAAIVVLSYPSLEPIEIKTASMKQKFPYIPGFLGFREVPVLVEAYESLSTRPDLIMVDGHGVSHPRGLGVASHLGVLLDVPTIGVAKSILVGHPSDSLPDRTGSMVSLIWKSKEIGKIVRTKKNCSPLIISAGHKVGLERAAEFVLNCLKGYRLPEPTRQAHLQANLCRSKRN
jgi:deoxyribonuclease V